MVNTKKPAQGSLVTLSSLVRIDAQSMLDVEVDAIRYLVDKHHGAQSVA